jgi:hypothetical protein
MKNLLACALALTLGGCVSSKVATLEPGVYTLSFTDLTGFGSRTQAMQRAVEDADEYCGPGKAAHLVNMVDGRTMPLAPFQASIVFRCAAKK